jgi:predicted HTH domain antitoxin
VLKGKLEKRHLADPEKAGRIALRKYREGEVSLGKAAEIAGLSV